MKWKEWRRVDGVKALKDRPGSVGGRIVIAEVDGERCFISIDDERRYLHVSTREAFDYAQGPYGAGDDPVAVAVRLVRAARAGKQGAVHGEGRPD